MTMFELFVIKKLKYVGAPIKIGEDVYGTVCLLHLEDDDTISDWISQTQIEVAAADVGFIIEYYLKRDHRKKVTAENFREIFSKK
jgi:hypothetical protein